MTTSCPYCGAALQLNFCVVCGRQSSAAMNKIGSLQSVARNTDITQRLEDPLESEKYRKTRKSQRLKKLFKFILECTAGGLIVAILILIGAQQIIDYHMVNRMNRIMPWLESQRFKFPNYWATQSTKMHVTTATKSTTHKAKTKHPNKANVQVNRDSYDH